MSFLSYAQNYEDVRLWRAFADVATGRYIDIGTQDPVRDSVSLAFYERGWKGVHVEPTPAYAAAMRAARPDEMVIEAAVSNVAGPLTFYEIPETGLSTGVRDIAERHAEAGWAFQHLKVQTITLADLFNQIGEGPIQWLKIDVEGMESDVLASWGDHPARPAALVIEATAPNTQIPTHQEWYDYVLSRGYIDVLFDGLSRYFVHETETERAAALALSPNVFDGFHVASTHFSAGRLVAEDAAEIATLKEQAEADKLTALEAAQEAAETERAEALAKVKAEAETERADAIAAIWVEADALREKAVSVTRGQANEIMQAVRTELEARVAAGEKIVADARLEISVQQEKNLALAREAGQLQGELDARAEAYALSLGQLDAARLNLEEQLSEVAQRLAKSEAGREQAEQQRDQIDRQGKEQAAALLAELDQRSALTARYEQLLAQATQLIRNAPDPIAGWPRSIASGLARLAGRKPRKVMADYANQISSWHNNTVITLGKRIEEAILSVSVDASTPAIDFEQFQRVSNMHVGGSPITSVPPLIARHDAEFIRVAYEAVLGRAPDHEGAAYYLERLRAGTHKLEILRQMRRSPEGRNFIPGVAGLDRAIKRHRMANLPLVGWILRLYAGGESNSAIERQLRIVSNEIGLLRVQQADLCRDIAAIASRQLAMAYNGVAPSSGKTEGTPQEAQVLPPTSISNLPKLANTLTTIAPATNFDNFLTGFKASVAGSREAAMLNQP